MDLKEGCGRCPGLAENAAGDVGLAVAKGFRHPPPALFNPAFLFPLPETLAVPFTLGDSLSCLLGDKGHADRPGSERQDAKNPLHRMPPPGCIRAVFRLELSALGGIKHKYSPRRAQRARRLDKGKNPDMECKIIMNGLSKPKHYRKDIKNITPTLPSPLRGGGLGWGGKGHRG